MSREQGACGQKRYSATRDGGKFSGSKTGNNGIAIDNVLFGQAEQAGRYRVRPLVSSFVDMRVRTTKRCPDPTFLLKGDEI